MADTQGGVVAHCPKCSAPIRDTHPYPWCPKCEKRLPENIKALIPAFAKKIREAEEGREEARKKRAEKATGVDPVIVTTAHALEGYRVVETLDVISAECVLGVSVFGDIFTAITDLTGGRSGTAQNKLREARKACLCELRSEAVTLGANAVIAVALNYGEISGGGKSMLFLVASGTAVKVEPVITDRREPSPVSSPDVPSDLTDM
jgi:uncharacterized protein YbjQ (UPF0145 family)